MRGHALLLSSPLVASIHISRPSSAYVSFPSLAHVSRSSSVHVSLPSCLTPSSNCKKSWRLLFWLTSVRQNPVAATIFVKIEALKKTCCGSCAQDSICSKETEQFRSFPPSSSAGSVAWFKISRGKISRRRMNSGKKVKSQSSYGAGVPADLDPPRFGPPGPNPLADTDPPVQIR